MSVLLAKKFDASKHNVIGWLASEKLDGIRAYWTGSNLVTRSGKPIHAPAWWLARLPKGVELDGELFCGRGEFQTASSYCRKKRPVDAEWKQVSYMVFDKPSHPGNFAQRYQSMKADSVNWAFPVKLVKHWEITSDDKVSETLEYIESQGGEGIMLRDPDSLYERKRSKSLLKVKTFQDDEATIIGYQEGGGKYRGMLGALVCEMTNGTRFEIGTGFSDAQRANPPAIGEQVTYKFFELTKAGVPRFPVFVDVRFDK